jgi:hypothetical protein
MIAAVANVLVAGSGLVRIGAAVYAGSVLRTRPRPRLRDVWQGARPIES